MQLSALKENLITVRTELRNTNAKLASLEQIKAEKAGLFDEFIYYVISSSF
jgi:hypothetical protein